MQKDDNRDVRPSALPGSPSDSDHDTSSGAFPPSAKLRDKLNKLANRRLDLSSIEFLNGAPELHGGCATVSRASLVSPSSGRDGTSQSNSTKKAGLDLPGEASRQRKDVAVKKMHLPDGPADGPARILGLALREAEFLVGLSHENVVKLEGFVEDLSKDVVWLVFPWAENGNLKSFIASADWEIPERIWLINDVARGVEYLHSRQPPIRHGDLKSINILVNSEYRAVITDFGSARYQKTEDLDEEISRAENKPPPAVSLEPAFNGATNTMTLTLKGDHFTLRWAAPELLYKRKATLASDIWALGCVVYEVMTNSIPFHDVDVSNVVAIRIVTGNLPSITNDDRMALIKALCSLALACWSEDPRKRPTAEDCRKSINWMASDANYRPDPIRTADATVSRAHQPELLMKLGWMHVQQGDYTKALGFFNDAMSSYEDVGDSERKAAALHQAAQVLRLRNEYSQAVTFYSEALQIFTDVGNMQGIASALLGLAEMHRFRTEYSQAVTLYSDALQTYTDIGDRLGRVTALLGLAEVHECRMEYSQAITFYSEVIKASTDIGNRHARAKALQGLAAVHLARKEYSQALPFLSEALQIRTDIGDNYGRAATLQSLARVHEFQKEYSLAVALFSEALEICTDIGDQYGRAHSLAGLGDVCCNQGNYGDAIGFSTEAAEVFGQVGDAHNAAFASNQVAKARQLSMREEAT